MMTASWAPASGLLLTALVPSAALNGTSFLELSTPLRARPHGSAFERSGIQPDPWLQAFEAWKDVDYLKLGPEGEPKGRYTFQKGWKDGKSSNAQQSRFSRTELLFEACMVKDAAQVDEHSVRTWKLVEAELEKADPLKPPQVDEKGKPTSVPFIAIFDIPGCRIHLAPAEAAPLITWRHAPRLAASEELKEHAESIKKLKHKANNLQLFGAGRDKLRRFRSQMTDIPSAAARSKAAVDRAQKLLSEGEKLDVEAQRAKLVTVDQSLQSAVAAFLALQFEAIEMLEALRSKHRALYREVLGLIANVDDRNLQMLAAKDRGGQLYVAYFIVRWMRWEKGLQQALLALQTGHGDNRWTPPGGWPVDDAGWADLGLTSEQRGLLTIAAEKGVQEVCSDSARAECRAVAEFVLVPMAMVEAVKSGTHRPATNPIVRKLLSREGNTLTVGRRPPDPAAAYAGLPLVFGPDTKTETSLDEMTPNERLGFGSCNGLITHDLNADYADDHQRIPDIDSIAYHCPETGGEYRLLNKQWRELVIKELEEEKEAKLAEVREGGPPGVGAVVWDPLRKYIAGQLSGWGSSPSYLMNLARDGQLREGYVLPTETGPAKRLPDSMVMWGAVAPHQAGKDISSHSMMGKLVGLGNDEKALGFAVMLKHPHHRTNAQGGPLGFTITSRSYNGAGGKLFESAAGGKSEGQLPEAVAKELYRVLYRDLIVAGDVPRGVDLERRETSPQTGGQGQGADQGANQGAVAQEPHGDAAATEGMVLRCNVGETLDADALRLLDSLTLSDDELAEVKAEVEAGWQQIVRTLRGLCRLIEPEEGSTPVVLLQGAPPDDLPYTAEPGSFHTEYDRLAEAFGHNFWVTMPSAQKQELVAARAAARQADELKGEGDAKVKAPEVAAKTREQLEQLATEVASSAVARGKKVAGGKLVATLKPTRAEEAAGVGKAAIGTGATTSTAGAGATARLLAGARHVQKLKGILGGDEFSDGDELEGDDAGENPLHGDAYRLASGRKRRKGPGLPKRVVRP